MIKVEIDVKLLSDAELMRLCFYFSGSLSALHSASKGREVPPNDKCIFDINNRMYEPLCNELVIRFGHDRYIEFMNDSQSLNRKHKDLIDKLTNDIL